MPEARIINNSLKASLLRLLERGFWEILSLWLISLGALGWFLILGPQFSQLQESGTLQYLSAQTQLTEKQRYLESLRMMQLTYQKLDWRDLRKLAIVLPETGDQAELFRQLESFAAAEQLTLTGASINTLDEKTNKNLEVSETLPTGVTETSITLNLTGGGDYSSMKKLLSAVENNAQIFNLAAWTFAPNTTDYTLNLTTYYWKGGENVGN